MSITSTLCNVEILKMLIYFYLSNFFQSLLLNYFYLRRSKEACSYYSLNTSK
jgi:hypothetical protein